MKNLQAYEHQLFTNTIKIMQSAHFTIKYKRTTFNL